MPASRYTDEQFMQALTDLMLREGCSRLTVGEIAARLNCSRRRLYALARSKEELFLKVADAMFRAVREQGWLAARRQKTASERFHAYLEAGLVMVRRTSEAFYADMDALPAGRALFDSHQRERIAGLETLIAEGIESGEFAEFHARVVAEMLLAVSRRMREPDFSARTGATFDEAFSELSRVFRDGLRRRPNNGPARAARSRSRSL